jgi:hypothetical protein
MTNRWILVGWGYASELVLTIFVCLGFKLLFPAFRPGAFVIAAWEPLSVTSGLLLAGAFAVLIAFYQQNNTEFGRYLHWRSAFGVYSLAFITPVAVYILTVVTLVLAGYSKSAWVAMSGFLLFVYSLINLYSLIWNLHCVMRLHNLFREQLQSAELSAARDRELE